MADTNEEPGNTEHAKFAKRDAETQMVLGSFVAFISIPVLIGTLWAEKLSARVVNLVAGSVLLAIGLGIALYGLKKRRSI